MTGWDATSLTLLDLLARAERGPRREGLYALWLTVRVAEDLLLPDPPLERAHRRRVAALESRLSSLTIPAPLRRALAASVSQLKEPGPAVAGQVLSQLVAPAREATGPQAAEAVAQAARRAREQASRLLMLGHSSREGH